MLSADFRGFLQCDTLTHAVQHTTHPIHCLLTLKLPLLGQQQLSVFIIVRKVSCGLYTITTAQEENISIK
jgi:hypothetical protein